MKYPITVLTFLLLLSLSTKSNVSSQTPQDDSEKPLYAATGNEASVVGTITATGTIPKPLKIDMTADLACVELVRRPQTEWFVVNGSKLKNAFVYVIGEQLRNHRFAVPTSEVTLQHRNCGYSPRVVGMQVGQPLHILNNDPTQHNTHPTPKMNQEWNYSQGPNAPPIVKTFTRPELLIPFKCNQHPWEKAYVGVLKHPFFAVTDELGRFEIRGLPAGEYRLFVWHEKLGELEQTLTLAPGEIRNADFTFDKF